MRVRNGLQGCRIVQTAENRTVSLKAIDGLTAGLEIRTTGPASIEAQAVAAAVGRLLDAARAGMRCRSDASAAPGAPVSIGAAGPTGESFDGVSITRIRAFYPIVRSKLGGLDLAVVTSERGDSVDPDAIRAAAAYATRFERRRIHVVAGDELDVDALQARHPELDFIVMPVAKLIGRFAAGRNEAEVVVAPPEFATILTEVAGVLSGAATLATVTRFSAAGITVEAASHGDEDMPAVRPSALILAAADLLVWLGRSQPAARIVNGWARTLEHGCHTAEFSVLSPYSRQLDADEFAEVVASRLGEQPRALQLRQPGTDRQKPRTTGSHLRLVSRSDG